MIGNNRSLRPPAGRDVRAAGGGAGDSAEARAALRWLRQPKGQGPGRGVPPGGRRPPGARDVLLILTDGGGFGVSSTFGGPIPTATMDRLAESGLRYNNFHTTALCSPTRAALLSGRNHHSAATGVIMELGSGFPGYNSLMPERVGTFAEVLKQNGWNTAWYGKNHNVPDWQGSQAGPYDLWPTRLGFEYFYGFIGGDVSRGGRRTQLLQHARAARRCRRTIGVPAVRARRRGGFEGGRYGSITTWRRCRCVRSDRWPPRRSRAPAPRPAPRRGGPSGTVRPRCAAAACRDRCGARR